MKKRTNMTIWELFGKIWKYVIPYKSAPSSPR